MNALGLLRTLGPVDLRNVRREPMLAVSVVLPLGVALLLRWGVPALSAWLGARHGFDLAPYLPIFASGYLMVGPTFVGFIAGFLLLDERDDGVLRAMQVTPVSLRSLLAYRLGVPVALAVAVTLAGWALLDLVVLPPGALLATVALAAFNAPMLALFLGAFAENKVSGFAMMKLYGAATDLPLAAWFAPEPAQWLAGLFPTYWPMKVVWQAAAGEAWLPFAWIGLAVNVAALALLLARFRRVMTR
jgi:fluoroquinolone transport system permease protein